MKLFGHAYCVNISNIFIFFKIVNIKKKLDFMIFLDLIFLQRNIFPVVTERCHLCMTHICNVCLFFLIFVWVCMSNVNYLNRCYRKTVDINLKTRLGYIAGLPTATRAAVTGLMVEVSLSVLLMIRRKILILRRRKWNMIQLECSTGALLKA